MKDQELKFYEFSQNNSGGSFDVDDKVCHRLFIEASSAREAQEIAEELGCYWDGVDSGSDCPCCGDRWYPSDNEVDLEKMNTKWKGVEVYEYLEAKKKGEVSKSAVISNFKSKFPGAFWTKEPSLDDKYGSVKVSGRIRMDSIDQYAQIMADQYGWTSPDCRIFYKNGEVKEIYSKKIDRKKR